MMGTMAMRYHAFPQLAPPDSAEEKKMAHDEVA